MQQCEAAWFGVGVEERWSTHTHTLFSLILSFFFFFSFTFLSSRLLLAPWCMAFFLQWLFQSAARDVINFIHTLWMLCLEKKKKERERERKGTIWGKKERGREREQPRERERERERERGERGGRKEIFSAVACIMNEGALCLKLQPGASLQGLLGRVGPCDLTPATRFILPIDAFTWHCGSTQWKNK